MKPLLIRHRVNEITDLRSIDPAHGVEIDLRADVTRKGRIYLAHDPWQQGDDFSAWLKEFSRLKIQGPILLNTKEDGLEDRIFELLKKFDLKNFLFLDTAFPTFIKWYNEGLGHLFFLRLSKYEDLSNLEQFKGSVKWVWVDCFDVAPMPSEIINKVSKTFKVCLVSPELQKGEHSQIKRFSKAFEHFDAVCTKHPDLWLKALSDS